MDEKSLNNIVATTLLEFLDERNQRSSLVEITQTLEKVATAESVEIKSFVELTDQQKDKLIQFVTGMTSKRLPMEYRIDKSLLGGFTIKVGEWFLDASLLADVALLKKQLLS